MRIQRISKDIIYPQLSYKICGFFFEIHKMLGRYRNEKQYGDAFEKMLEENRINYVRERSLQSSFDGERKGRNIPDFIIENKIVVDFKSKDFITKEDYFQLQRYLQSCSKRLGLIVNFSKNTYTPKEF